MNIKSRVKSLEEKKEAEQPHVIIVDWGGDTLTINGEEMSREEAERRYPHADRVIFVDYEESNDSEP